MCPLPFYEVDIDKIDIEEEYHSLYLVYQQVYDKTIETGVTGTLKWNQSLKTIIEYKF